MVIQHRIRRHSVLTGLIFIFISIQGCTGLFNTDWYKTKLRAYTKSIVKGGISDLSVLSPLKVVRHSTPEIIVVEKGRVIGVATLFGFVTVVSVGKGMAAAGPIGGAAAGGFAGGFSDPIMGLMEEKMQNQQLLPDIGKLLVDKFLERATHEVPNWPASELEGQPIGSGQISALGAILEFDFLEIAVNEKPVNLHGLVSWDGYYFPVVATLKGQGGEILWKAQFTYVSKLYDRAKEPKEYIADNFKLLKEEMDFASDAAVSYLITDLKSGLK